MQDHELANNKNGVARIGLHSMLTEIVRHGCNQFVPVLLSHAHYLAMYHGITESRGRSCVTAKVL